LKIVPLTKGLANPYTIVLIIPKTYVINLHYLVSFRSSMGRRKEHTLISTKSNISCKYRLSKREIIQLTLECFRMLDSFKF
jgi:hypothetical protein